MLPLRAALISFAGTLPNSYIGSTRKEAGIDPGLASLVWGLSLGDSVDVDEAYPDGAGVLMSLPTCWPVMLSPDMRNSR